MYMPGCTLSGSLQFKEGLINGYKAQVLRDTGCTMIAVKNKFIDTADILEDKIKCKTITGELIDLSTAHVFLDTPYFKGFANVCILPNTAVADVIVGNVRGVLECDAGSVLHEIHYGCVATRAASRKDSVSTNFPLHSFISVEVTPEEFRLSQRNDDSLKSCFQKIGLRQKNQISFQLIDGFLYRVHSSKRTVTKQLVVPEKYRKDVLVLAHDCPMSGHQGLRRTKNRVTKEFYWPGLYKQINAFVRSCHICQKTAHRRGCAKAPLQSMPNIGVPFHRAVIDIIGPMIQTERKNRYILTVVDVATRWPEAIPLKDITSEHVTEALVSVFSRVGIPAEVLSDRGSNFLSSVMKDAMKLMGVKQVHTSPYHPQSNGLCERINGVLKHALQKMSYEKPTDWDRFINPVLFSYRELRQDGSDFSPFELLYGRSARGPTAVLKDLFTSRLVEPQVQSEYQYVIDLEQRIKDSCMFAKANLEKKALINASYSDKDTPLRELNVGDKVLILLPMTKNKLLMRWKGPFDVVERTSKVNYKVMIDDIPKIYHINMLKKYYERLEETNDVVTGASLIYEEGEEDDTLKYVQVERKENIKDIHICPDLTKSQYESTFSLLQVFDSVLSDLPGKTDIIQHEIRLVDNKPINVKQYPLPFNVESEIIEQVQEMLDLGIVQHSSSPYSFPIVMVKKKDGKFRLCIDFRKLNAMTISNMETIPNQEELFTKLSKAKYFSKIDLSRGYWQIPMEESSRQYTAFQTPLGLMEFMFMPFGLKNAPATFARAMRLLLHDIVDTISYFDDILVFSDTWNNHLKTLQLVLHRLQSNGIHAKPSKMSVGFPEIDFLGHIIGNGIQKPQKDKISKILKLGIPTTKKQVQSLMGLLNYYRKFIPNFAKLSTPLSNLVRKNQPNKVKWNNECNDSLIQIQSLFSSDPILTLPDLSLTFVVRADASDVAIGAMLLQNKDDILQPCYYASRKLSETEKKYAIVERECLAIVFAVRKFSRYLLLTHFVIQTDHKPLLYLKQKQSTNSRLLRWALTLQEYDFTINAIKGCQNVHGDVLSRL